MAGTNLLPAASRVGLALQVPAQPVRPAPVIDGRGMTKTFEGFRPYIYKDTAKPTPKRTVGYGFNVDDKGIAQFLPPDVVQGKRPITQEESDKIFDTLYAKSAQDAVRFVGPEAYSTLSPQKQAILTDLAYNLGPNKLAGFEKFKEAVLRGDSRRAAAELKNSKWYRQVGNRSKHHVLKWMED
jgi:lysozyme